MGNRTMFSSGEFIVNGGVDISPKTSFVGETLSHLLNNAIEQAELDKKKRAEIDKKKRAEIDKMKRTEIKNLGDKISGLLRDNPNCFYKVDDQNNLLSELQDDLSGPGCLVLGDIFINSEDGFYYFWRPDDSAIVINTRAISQSYVTDGGVAKNCSDYDTNELKSILSEASNLIDYYEGSKTSKTDGKVHRYH